MIKEWWKTPEQAAERSPLPVCQPTNDGRRRQDSRLCRCSRSAAAWNRDDPLQLIPGVFDRLTGDISYSRRARVVFQTDMSNINRMLYSHYCKVCLYEYVYWHSKLDTNFFGTTSASFVAAFFLSLYKPERKQKTEFQSGRCPFIFSCKNPKLFLCFITDLKCIKTGKMSKL